MSLSLEQVSYTYPGGTAGLHEVSFSIGRGELVAVIGASGSGKSTLLKLVAGLVEGHTGQISLNGDNLSGRPVHQRNIGVVFQSYALFPHLNVLDNVAYGLKLRRVSQTERHQRAQELLELVGMGALAGRAISQLSGGQQQRVALARALAINPSALLLDEPLAALDASIRGHLRDLIRELQQRFGATTLLVTHDQEEALTMADRVAVLQDGRLLQLATPREIYEHPNSVAVARFVGRATLLAATIAGPGELDLGYAKLKVDTGARACGAAVHALIRPEHIVADPPVGTLNRLPGHCGVQRYLGSGVRHDFHPEGAAQALLAESAQVATRSIAIAPEHIHLLDH